MGSPQTLVDPLDSPLEVVEYSCDSPLRHPGKLVAAMFGDFIRSRELIWTLFTRDMRAQFRQSVLGYLWLLLPPVATAAVWLFLQSQKILNVQTEIPYPVFILVGTTVWISFVNLINAPLQGFNNGKAIYTKLNVPPEAFVMSAVLRAILNFLIRIGILIPVFVYFKFTPPWTAFLFPVAVMSFFLIALAIGLWAIPFGSLFSDVGNFLTNFVRIFMYLSPVIYPIGRKTGWFKAIMVYNPLTPGVAWSRDTITTGSYEWAVPCLVYGGISVILIFLALIFLRISRPHLVARLGM
ncbi:MAG: ABC transporter permease [Verrucomicrobiae bacterium]|nr:ABC transporter permease [Verrucomicrobiae bacterium]